MLRDHDRDREPISIHALREEGDLSTMFLIVRSDYFYPRPPRGGRPFPWIDGKYIYVFLSTPSARRATRPPSVHPKFLIEFLSTPSARRATPPSRSRRR